jgi:hypothetical protein
VRKILIAVTTAIVNNELEKISKETVEAKFEEISQHDLE